MSFMVSEEPMQHESRNISMLMDFYEMTMAHGYFTILKVDDVQRHGDH